MLITEKLKKIRISIFHVKFNKKIKNLSKKKLCGTNLYKMGQIKNKINHHTERVELSSA